MTSPSISSMAATTTTSLTPSSPSIYTPPATSSTPNPEYSSSSLPPQSSSSPTTFIFPKTYNFPPFFTLQPNTTTRQAQLSKWSALIQSYCAHHRIFRLPITSTTSSTTSTISSPSSLAANLFHNPTINKRLADPDIRTVLDFMVSDGRAEYLSSSASDQSAGSVLIWWRRPDEWGEMAAAWVDATGQRGSVLTLWEMVEGEGTEGQEFHGMEVDVLRRCLSGLVKRGKAQVFGAEDQLGVKFF